MDVTREDVLRCARLACLDLDEAEVEPLRRDMWTLLNHAASLDSLDLEDVPPMGHPLAIPLACREDLVGDPLGQAEALANAPRQASGHFLVPKVL